MISIALPTCKTIFLLCKDLLKKSFAVFASCSRNSIVCNSPSCCNPFARHNALYPVNVPISKIFSGCNKQLSISNIFPCTCPLSICAFGCRLVYSAISASNASSFEEKFCAYASAFLLMSSIVQYGFYFRGNTSRF